MNEIFEKVKECICGVTVACEIEEGSLLKKDIGLDSLSLVSVIIALEDIYGITFDDSDLDPAMLVTVRNLMTIVEKYV